MFVFLSTLFLCFVMSYSDCHVCYCDLDMKSVTCRGKEVSYLILDSFWRKNIEVLSLYNTSISFLPDMTIQFERLRFFDNFNNRFLTCSELRKVPLYVKKYQDIHCVLPSTLSSSPLTTTTTTIPMKTHPITALTTTIPTTTLTTPMTTQSTTTTLAMTTQPSTTTTIPMTTHPTTTNNATYNVCLSWVLNNFRNLISEGYIFTTYKQGLVPTTVGRKADLVPFTYSPVFRYLSTSVSSSNNTKTHLYKEFYENMTIQMDNTTVNSMLELVKFTKLITIGLISCGVVIFLLTITVLSGVVYLLNRRFIKKRGMLIYYLYACASYIINIHVT